MPQRYEKESKIVEDTVSVPAFIIKENVINRYPNLRKKKK